MKRLFGILAMLILTQKASALNLTPEGIYNATKEACSQLPEEKLLNGSTYDNAIGGSFPSKEFTEIIYAIKRQSFGNALSSPASKQSVLISEELKSSSEFKKALLECYPEHPKAFHFFYSIVDQAQNSGEFGAGVVLLYMFGGAGKIFRTVKGYFEGLLLGSVLVSDSNQDHREKKVVITSQQLEQGLRGVNPSASIDFDQKVQQYEEMIKECENNLNLEGDPRKREVLAKAISKFKETLNKIKLRSDK